MTAMLARLALVALLAWLALLAAVYMLQRRALYFPSAEPLQAADVRQAGLSFWPAEDGFRGLLAEPDTAPRATIVVFHGNAGSALDRGYYASALGDLGYRVLLAEYPGYAGRPGAPSEPVLVADGVATLSRLSETFPEPVIVWGESLGAAVAAGVIGSTDVPVRGAVLVTPWASLARLIAAKLPVLPAALLHRDRFDSAAGLAAFGGPVAVIVAGRDEVIPPAEGRRLYEGLSAPKRLWWFENATHNSWPVHPSAPWWREVTDFVLPPAVGDAGPRSAP